VVRCLSNNRRYALDYAEAARKAAADASALAAAARQAWQTIQTPADLEAAVNKAADNARAARKAADDAFASAVAAKQALDLAQPQAADSADADQTVAARQKVIQQARILLAATETVAHWSTESSCNTAEKIYAVQVIGDKISWSRGQDLDEEFIDAADG
jgi:hypothetical protein